MADVLIVIPARMASTRLPGKPLLDIAGVNAGLLYDCLLHRAQQLGGVQS